MIKITDLLPLENIKQGLSCSSKKRAFEIIGKIIATHMNNDGTLESIHENETICFESLFEREKLGNSSLGNGVGFPKGRLPMGEKPIAVFLQLKDNIDYNAIDHKEIDLIFALLIPNNICSQFINELSAITDIFKDKTICKQLRTAQSAEEIYHIFQEIEVNSETQLAQQEILERNE